MAKKQNLHISELVQLIFDLNIKMERFSIIITPKHIIFDYSWDKKETNKCFSKENRKTKLFVYAKDTEGAEHKRKAGTVGKLIDNLSK